jgi:hypothetical protein
MSSNYEITQKYIKKAKFLREKKYANNEDDILKNEKTIIVQKEKRDQIRNHNLLIASGANIVNNDTIDKKDKKITEKKALNTANNNIVVQHFYDSGEENETE